MTDAYGRCEACHGGQCCGLVAQLSAALAAVTAERERLQAQFHERAEELLTEQLAHTETREALDNRLAACQAFSDALESTRAELAKAEWRVKELEQFRARCSYYVTSEDLTALGACIAISELLRG